MSRPSRSPFRAIAIALLLAAPSAAASPLPRATPPPKVPAEAGAPAVRVELETIAVDRRGTWSAGSDLADIFPGSSGVLKKTITLMGRQEHNPPREMLRLRTRITPSRVSGAACRLRVEAEATSVISGARAPVGGYRPERKTVTVTLQEEEERLVEIYSSAITEGRVALKVRCGPAEEATESGEPHPIEFSLAISRGEDEKPLQSLKTDRLPSMPGREVNESLSFNVPLPEEEDGSKRYRRDRLEVTIAPSLISGGKIQAEVHVQGDLATISATGPSIAHPVDRRETVVLEPGESASIDLTVRSSGPEEGWSEVRYRFDISGSI